MAIMALPQTYENIAHSSSADGAAVTAHGISLGADWQATTGNASAMDTVPSTELLHPTFRFLTHFNPSDVAEMVQNVTTYQNPTFLDVAYSTRNAISFTLLFLGLLCCMHTLLSINDADKRHKKTLKEARGSTRPATSPFVFNGKEVVVAPEWAERAAKLPSRPWRETRVNMFHDAIYTTTI